ncbi:hypothetical protein HMPREF0185_01692 [Brevundimonas diminuta 470-4]|nr:hypothetical protein HMPREF0185_01692 [Brevundimonas diminuta 470-4]
METPGPFHVHASTGRARASAGLDASTNQAIIPYLILDTPR